MNLKKILISLLALSIAASLASCGKKCDGHVDKNDDGKCDNCEEAYEDGDEEEELVKEQCTFTVVDSDGNTVSGAKFTLTLGSVTESLTSGAGGVATAELYAGKYTVEFDYDSIPSGFLPDTSSVEVSAESKSFELILMNNNPNGTAERPYFITEDETPLDLAANGEIHYVLRGGAGKTLVIENSGVSVTYNGTSYSPVDGVISIPIESTIGSMNSFSVKNTESDDNSIVIKLVSPLGSMDNPIAMTENSVTANAPVDGSVCYKWTASSAGVLVLTSSNERNNITLTNSTTNAVSTQTDGSAGEYMIVAAGDEVIISVSAKAKSGDSSAFVDIEFVLACYAGTREEPIPVIKNFVDLSLSAGATLVFSMPGAATVVIEDDAATVTYNGTEYTPDAYGRISVNIAAGDDLFTLTNTSDSMNGIEIKIN